MNDSDRNFNDLAHRFKRNVYDRLKGDIRLEVLQRDLQQFLGESLYQGSAKPLRILDAGGGQGQLSLSLAALGHNVVICDISEQMLQYAREHVAKTELHDRVSIRHQSIQQLAQAGEETFDLVLCHAVLEWVVEPRELLQNLVKLTKSGGYQSLTFYNVNSIKMKNLLRTNFKKVIEDDYRGYRGSLTPTWPRQPEEVYQWLRDLPLEELCHSGIRCFHDYILDPEHRVSQPDEQMVLELRFSREEPWRSLARYIHVLSKKQ